MSWGGGEAARRAPGGSQPAVTAHDQKRAQLVHLGTAARSEGLSVTGKQPCLGQFPEASPGPGAALGGAWHGCVAHLSRGRWCVLQAMTRALAPCLAWHPPGSPAPRAVRLSWWGCRVALGVAPGAECGRRHGCWSQHLLTIILLWASRKSGRLQAIDANSLARVLSAL